MKRRRKLRLSEAPGLGVEPDLRRLERYRVRI